MKLKLNLFLALPALFLLFNLQANAFSTASQDSTVDNCIACHQDNDNMPDNYNPEDIHYKVGLSCFNCHGGNPKTEDEDAAMDPDKGFLGAPSKEEIPAFCGRCHSDFAFMQQYRSEVETDQESQYYTSQHGTLLKKGDTKVAVCSNCHTAHSIFSPNDPRSSVYPANLPETCNACHGDAEYMKDYSIPTNQYKLYKTSVHGIDLYEKHDMSAPVCNDCHGNHGARPPELNSIPRICGSCHVKNLNYFSSSPMGKEMEEEEIHTCETCHGYHDIQKASDDFIGTGEKSFCIECHDEGDEGYITAAFIKSRIDTLKLKYSTASDDMNNVIIKGMDDIDISFKLKEARQKLIETRTAIHSFDTSQVNTIASQGIKLSNEAIGMAQKEMDEYYNRRTGFIYSSIALLILGLALYLKIRTKNGKDKKA
ncbi:MAG: hypothetical protein GXO87_04150 [Chlorobi bacterium]|nr:hypothetical protein [Chlorobiota bacterium]